MINYTGSLAISGGLHASDGESATASGTLGITLPATLDGSSSGTGTETVQGNIVVHYNYSGGSTTETLPINFTTPSFSFQLGTFDVSEQLPVSVLGAELGVSISGAVSIDQKQISENIVETVNGSYQGISFYGTFTANGTLTAAAAPPAISGTALTQTTTDASPVTPFSGLTVTDSNAGQTETLTVTLSAPESGTLTNLGGGSFNSTTGTYTVSGTAAAVTADLDGLVFDPARDQAPEGQTVTTTFAITVTDSAGESASRNGPDVISTQTSPTYALVESVYQAVLRTTTPTSAITRAAQQIDGGQTNLAQISANLIGSDQAIYTTLAALVTIEAFYGAVPGAVTLTSVAAATNGTAYYTAAELHNLGYSDPNVWTVLASGWGADPTSSFFNQYDMDATGTTAGYTSFINAVYQREFGFVPSAANLQNLLSDIPGVQALLNGGGHTASPIQVMAGVYGYLLFVGQTNDIGQYAAGATTYLQALAGGIATPSISGAVAGQTVSDMGSLSPFSGVSISDPNTAQSETVTVTLSAAANGTLSNLGGGSYDALTGVFSDRGTAATVTADLNGLVFTPNPQAGTTTTTFIINDTDTAGAAVSNETTTVLATAPVAGAPLITSVTWNNATQTVNILGSNFGSQASYNGDSNFLNIDDHQGAGFSAGYTGPGAYDLVGLNVTSWTNSAITIQGFTGSYGSGSWVFHTGDSVTVYVANPEQTAPTGPRGASWPTSFNLTIPSQPTTVVGTIGSVAASTGPVAGPSAQSSAGENDPSDTAAVITVTTPAQLIDPGVGNHSIVFLSESGADTLVLHAGGTDLVSGFDPNSDFLDFSSLLSGANIDLKGNLASLANYVIVSDQGGNALVNFDPSGLGGGSTVAVLQGLGTTITGLNALISAESVRIA